jgi:hypothetical protein
MECGLTLLLLLASLLSPEFLEVYKLLHHLPAFRHRHTLGSELDNHRTRIHCVGQMPRRGPACRLDLLAMSGTSLALESVECWERSSK